MALRMTRPAIWASLADFAFLGRIVDSLPVGQKSLIEDGAAADPASNGVGVLVAHFSHPSETKYLNAAKNQLNFLLYETPHGGEGQISHRTEQVQYWAGMLS